MKKFLRLSLVVSLAMVLFAPTFVNATTLFDGSVNTDAACGSGGCFGLTYELIITDANDANGITYTGEIKITGTYTGSETFIASLDFKPDGNTITSATLTAAPGGTGGWTTTINLGQAAGDCASSGEGFICSNDTGTNSLAPVTNGGVVNYDWQWNFIMSGAVDPGHLGARFNNAGDTDNGQIVSISTFSRGPGQEVPEPSSLILLGSGLIMVATALRRRFSQKQQILRTATKTGAQESFLGARFVFGPI